MNQQQIADAEIQQRLDELLRDESNDPTHAKLSGKTLGTFLAVVVFIAGAAWIGALL